MSSIMCSADRDLHFFHGLLQKETAEALLQHHGMADGLFLVRESSDGQLMLDMAYQVGVERPKACRSSIVQALLILISSSLT